LLDLRDGGRVWWQDHATRELSEREDLFSDLVTRPARRRAVPTPALCDRYQWLVWLLAVPLVRNGTQLQSIDDLVRNGIGRFREQFPDRAEHDALFERELPQLTGDPHLAIYWLLHTTVLADDERRARVVRAVGRTHPLLTAFVTCLGNLPLAGDLPVVPEFRARRALAQTYGAFEVPEDQLPVVCLRALEISPATLPLGHGLQVIAGLERGALDDATVAATLARITEPSAGTALLAAVLDKRKKLGSSAHADALARSLATTDAPWWRQLEALWHVHELAYDGPALVAATRRIVAHDRYHRRALQMAMRAAQIANESIDAIYADLGVADAVLPAYTKLVEQPDQWEDTVRSLPLPALRRALAVRVLQRVELNRPAPPLAAWAAGQVLGSTDPDRQRLVGDALARLDAQTQLAVIESAGTQIDGADHPLVAMLLAFLETAEPDESDLAGQFALERGKEAALRALARWVREPALFDTLMAMVEKPGTAGFVGQLFKRLFSPFEKDSYILHQLDGAQATRVAKAMVRTQLRHPNIHARNAAGHQLYRFDHPGAETYLIDALTDNAVLYAAGNDALEDVVANLYAAVRNLKTPAARAALVDRLFAERRSYWRMGRALADIWDPALHAEIMRQLDERKDARAAGAYAFTLREFVKQVPPLVELTAMIHDWQGDNEVTRGFLHYALVAGMLAALDAGDVEVLRRAHDAASWISEPPLEPDAHGRGRTWQSPLDDEELAARIARALAGEPESAPTLAAAPAKHPKTKPTKAKKPAAKKPAAKKPAAKKPAAKKPAAKKPAAKKPKPAPKPKATAKPKPKATKPKPKRRAKPKRSR
jgi:hypothetical protein